MKKLTACILLALPILACNFVAGGLGPAPRPIRTAGSPDFVTPVRTPRPGEPTFTPAPTPTPFKLGLERINPLPTQCSESPFGLPAERISEVAYVPSGFCFNGEIDTFELGGRMYVVQSLGTEAAFFITDVSDPQNPSIVGAWQWNDFPYTADVKAFKQGDRRYLALSLEPMRDNLCGTAIVEVTDPAGPVLVDNYTGANTVI